MELNVIDLLQERGFIEQMTDPDLRNYVVQSRKVYVGFDPTADSLHLGNLVPIIALEWFRRCGHTPHGRVLVFHCLVL
jgi:tyrosyl-tRNA synthetase